MHEIPEHTVIRNNMTTFFHQRTKWHNVISDKGIDNTATRVRKEKKRKEAMKWKPYIKIDNSKKK